MTMQITLPETTASAERKEIIVTTEIKKIALAYTRSFTVDEIAQAVVKSAFTSALPMTGKDESFWRKKVSNVLGRMTKKKQLVRVRGKKGTYRRAGDEPDQVSSHPPEYETDNDSLKILRTIPKPLAMRLPLGLEEYVLIYPGDLIVVAGATNSGKTGWFLNLVQLNWHLFQVKYLTSELSDVRLSIRLHDFCEVHGTLLEDWEREVDFKSQSSNFPSAMNPAGLNVVDYLEIYKDFHEIGLPIKEIFKRQQGQPGITFVGLQMKHGNGLGRGGALAMEKPFLYLTMDYFKEAGLNRLVIEKAKDPAREDVNPNGLAFWFRIEKGCKFIPVEKPINGDALVARARKEANGGK